MKTGCIVVVVVWSAFDCRKKRKEGQNKILL